MTTTLAPKYLSLVSGSCVMDAWYVCTYRSSAMTQSHHVAPHLPNSTMRSPEGEPGPIVSWNRFDDTRWTSEIAGPLSGKP
eukprot:3045111-Alexandrium_andersonii.AAC.1